MSENKFDISTQVDIQKIKTNFSDFEQLCRLEVPKSRLLSYQLFTNSNGDLYNVGPSSIARILRASNFKIYSYTKDKFVKLSKVDYDFAGFYIFYKDKEPIYCGISRNVLKRITNHTKGEKQSATFAHRLAMSDPNYSESNYKKLFEDYKKELLTYEFKLLKFYKPCKDSNNRYTKSTEQEEEILLYLFEVFASVYFNTPYNSFRTH